MLIVKISATHDSIEGQFGCPAYLEHYAIRHELKNHYYSNHPEILPVTQHQRQCQTSNSDDSMAQEQEKATTSDDSDAEQQHNVTSNDGAPTTEQLKQSEKQNKRRASSNDSIEASS